MTVHIACVSLINSVFVHTKSCDRMLLYHNNQTQSSSPYDSIPFLVVDFLLVFFPCWLLYFSAFTGFIQGLSFPDSIARMRSQFFPCWKRNLMFWIPTQMFMFGILAEKWQIPFACLMGMLWSMILSKYAGSTKKSKQNWIHSIKIIGYLNILHSLHSYIRKE